MRARAGAPATLALLLAVAPAQDRRPLLGTVVGADGKPLANATVQLACVPRGGEAEVAADHTKATTDHRGRFRADVLPCADYKLWAVGPADADGFHLASGIAQANANQVVELRAARRFAARRAIVTGADAWTELAPLQLRVAPGGVELPGMTFPIGPGERVDLPPLPDAFVTFEVLDKNGAVVRAQCHGTTGDFHVGAPRLQPLALRVVDVRGVPVAGAEIRSRTVTPGQELGLLPAARPRTHWRLLGTTGADGRLMADVPCEQDPFAKGARGYLFLLAHKAGRAASVSGIAHGPFHDGRQVTEAEIAAREELLFALRPPAPLRMRVVAGEKPVAGLRVTVRATLRITMDDRNSWMNDELTWQRSTDADGRIEIADLPPNCHRTTFALAADAATAGLPAALHKELPLHPVLLHELPQPPTKPVVFDLNACKLLRLSLLDENKAPARDARLLLLDSDGELWNEWTPEFVPNGTGHLTLLLQPGTWTLFARNETSYAFRAIDTAAEPDLALPLEPLPAVRGKVVDAEGKPVAGARLHGTSMVARGLGGTDARLMGIAQSDCWSRAPRTCTAADGTFECRLLLLPSMHFQGAFHLGDKSTAEFEMTAGDEPVTLTMQ